MILIRQASLLISLLLAWLWGFPYGPSFGLAAWVIALVGLSVALLNDPIHLRTIRLALLFAAMISVAFAFLQYAGVAEVFAPWVSASAQGQAYANLRQPNQFASLCAIGWIALLLQQADLNLPAAKFEGMHSSGIPERTPYFMWILTGWLALGNAMTASRTGAIQWLAASMW